MSATTLDSTTVCGRHEPVYRRDRDTEFDAIAKLVGRPIRGPILDIGFGAGHLLDRAASWGVAKSARYGVEVSPELQALGRAKGYQLLDTNFGKAGVRFDLITAVDVLEHLTADESQRLFVEVAASLTEDGVFVARYPNGASPFGRLWQHGDPTHIRALTSSALEHEAELAGLRLIRVCNLRPVPASVPDRIRRRMVYAVRDAVEVTLGFAYFGKRVPMDGNQVSVFRLAPG